MVVEGGTLAWNEAGLPVERGAIKVMSLERQVRIAAGSLVLSGIVLGSFVHRGFFGLSAFAGAELGVRRGSPISVAWLCFSRGRPVNLRGKGERALLPSRCDEHGHLALIRGVSGRRWQHAADLASGVCRS